MSNQSNTAPETKPDNAAPKPRINHGTPHPQADMLVATLYRQIIANPMQPATVLQWLTTQPADIVRLAIMRSQTAPWSIVSEVLVDSLTDEQARAVLAVAVVGFMQGRFSVQQTQTQQRR